MGAINFNDGPPYDRLDIASAAATARSDGVEITLTAYVFGQPAATVPFTVLLDPAVARALAAQLGPAAERRCASSKGGGDFRSRAGFEAGPAGKVVRPGG
jgi:hypothetical protein